MKKSVLASAVAVLLVGCGPTYRPVNGVLASGHPSGTLAVATSGLVRSAAPVAADGTFQVMARSGMHYRLRFATQSGTDRSVLGLAVTRAGTPLNLPRSGPVALGLVGDPNQTLAVTAATTTCQGDGEAVTADSAEAQAASSTAEAEDQEQEGEDSSDDGDDVCGNDDQAGD